MSVLCKIGSQFQVFTKGAPEKIKLLCKSETGELETMIWHLCYDLMAPGRGILTQDVRLTHYPQILLNFFFVFQRIEIHKILNFSKTFSQRIKEYSHFSGSVDQLIQIRYPFFL
jgi:hypothetical protein